MRMADRTRWFLGVLAVAVGALGVVMAPAPAGAAHKTVSVPIVTEAVGQYRIAVVKIRVGGGPPVAVQLDTGSSGLVIASSAIGRSVSTTRRSYSDHYVSGTVQGRVDRGSVSIGGLSTPPSTAFSVVSSSKLFSPGTKGILGIAMTDDLSPTVVYSPLLQLPTPYWQGVTVTLSPRANGRGSLVIGPVGRLSGAVALPMYPAKPATYPGGRPAYQKDTTMCWQIGQHPDTCGLTDMDLGFPTPAVNTTFAPGAAVGAHYQPGQAVQVTSSTGAPLWSFTTGTSTAVPDELTVSTLSEGYTQFNTSIGFFFANSVAYAVTAREYLIAPNPLAD